MNSKIFITIGLILGMLGVVFIFIWGPPQPTLKPGIFLALEDKTPIDNTDKTVEEYNKEIISKRKLYSCMSKIGLVLIFIGFGCQLAAIWIPSKE